MEKTYNIENCRHKFYPLGIERIATTEELVEVIAVIFCQECGLFRTKILYFDRHHNLVNQKQA
ncbi:MAG: hypothetical protein WC549_00570 [Actinomycetota bacterium]